MAYYTYKDVVDNLPYRYEDTFEERHGREHDLGSDYNGDYWISVREYIEDLESRLEEYKSLVNEDSDTVINNLIDLNEKEVWEQ